MINNILGWEAFAGWMWPEGHQFMITALETSWAKLLQLQVEPQHTIQEAKSE